MRLITSWEKSKLRLSIAFLEVGNNVIAEQSYTTVAYTCSFSFFATISGKTSFTDFRYSSNTWKMLNLALKHVHLLWISTGHAHTLPSLHPISGFCFVPLIKWLVSGANAQAPNLKGNSAILAPLPEGEEAARSLSSSEGLLRSKHTHRSFNVHFLFSSKMRSEG